MPQDEIKTAADFIAQRIGDAPRLALVLGSGLGALADELKEAIAIPYAEIPGFPLSTAPGHAGRLVAGSLEGRRVLVMQGRFHCYEGYPASRIAFPIRVFRRLGVERLFLTNAAGGANPGFSPGDLMLITDHVNLTGQNPCIGENDPLIGPRFFDMSHAYDPELRAAARRAAAELGMGLREGVLRLVLRPELRDPGRGQDGEDPRRGCRGHVYRARGHRGGALRPSRARSILHHQPGRGHERQAHHVGGGPRDIGAREAPLLGLRQAYDFVHRLKGSVI